VTPSVGRGSGYNESAQVPAESLEQFAWLMLRGIEIRKVSRKAPNTKAPYKRYLYMNPQRSALLISKVPHADRTNAQGIRAQKLCFGQIQIVEASDTYSRRIKIVCHALAPLQFDVDTPRSRDILVRMLSKLVAHFSTITFICDGVLRSPQLIGETNTLYSRLGPTLSAGSTVNSRYNSTKKSSPLNDKENSSSLSCEDCCELPGVDCAVCLAAIEDPIQLPCTHMYCRSCLASWRNAAIAAQNRPSCPECRTRIPVSYGKLLSQKALKQAHAKRVLLDGLVTCSEQP